MFYLQGDPTWLYASQNPQLTAISTVKKNIAPDRKCYPRQMLEYPWLPVNKYLLAQAEYRASIGKSESPKMRQRLGRLQRMRRKTRNLGLSWRSSKTISCEWNEPAI